MMTLHSIQYGDTVIEYDLSYAVRKTLEISVHPDLRVTVTAPEDVTLDAVAARVKKRARWILRQQRELELYLPHIPPRQYVSGETHRYLGKQYRLKVVETVDVERVKLDGGYLYVWTSSRSDPDTIKALVNDWYLRQARRVFQERIAAIRPRFARLNLPEFNLRIRELQSRWGTCTDSGTITLNLKLMQVNKASIDYVIAHEMCHLIEHNHSKRFYVLLDRVMPDWRERRVKLNMQEMS